jgi:hypothetical protein
MMLILRDWMTIRGQGGVVVKSVLSASVSRCIGTAHRWEDLGIALPTINTLCFNCALPKRNNGSVEMDVCTRCASFPG